MNASQQEIWNFIIEDLDKSEKKRDLVYWSPDFQTENNVNLQE